MMNAYQLTRSLPHEFRAIPIAAIMTSSVVSPDPYSRTESDFALAQEVLADGVRIPITVDRQGDSYFRVLDGVRRLGAARLAGYTHIPAVVYPELSDGDANAVRYASQHTNEPLWTEREYPQVLRAILNAQLVAKKRGRYASEYKWRMLGLASDCTERGELSTLLRTERLAHSHLVAWRRQFDKTGSFEDRRVAAMRNGKKAVVAPTQPALV